MQNGLEAYDRRHEYRGPFSRIEATGSDGAQAFKDLKLPGGSGTWEAGLVTKVSDDNITLTLKDQATITLEPDDAKWARETYKREDGAAGLKVGDVVLAEFTRKFLKAEEAEAPTAREGSTQDEAETGPASEPLAVPEGNATLRQVPKADGALIALDPHTGRILAMAGGYSFWKSQFNRVTQASRQPGSSFKPFVHAAALENGYTPASQVLDAPFVDFDICLLYTSPSPRDRG